jgi:integrase
MKTTIATLKDALETYLRHHRLSDSSVGVYRRTFRAFDGFMSARLSSLSSDRFLDIIEEESTSINHERSLIKILKSVLGFAREIGMIEANPAAFIQMPRAVETEKRILLDWEYQEVWTVAEDRLRLALDLGRYAGLRHAETVHLRWQDAALDGGMLKVVNWSDFITKSGRTRTVPIPSHLIDTLRLWRMKNGLTICILDVGGRRWDGLYEDLKIARLASGVEEFRFHDLRRTRLTELATSGMQPAELMAYAGHSSYETTAKYYVQANVKLMQEKVREVG